jgi:hypothetical protein
MTISSRIFSLLSPLFDGRVYPGLAPAGTARPFAVYTKAGVQPNGTLNSAGTADRRLVQIDIYTDSYDEGEALSDEARSLIELGGGRLQSEGYEPPAGEYSLHRHRRDYYVWQRPGS